MMSLSCRCTGFFNFICFVHETPCDGIVSHQGRTHSRGPNVGVANAIPLAQKCEVGLA